MNSKRILLVEDNSDDEYLAVLAMKKTGLQNIQVARDGVEALEILLGSEPGNKGLPDLVVLDLRLPKMDGLEVLARVRSDPRTGNLPVMVLTSSEDQKDKEVSARLKVRAFVSKPLSSAVLLEVLSTIN